MAVAVAGALSAVVAGWSPARPNPSSPMAAEAPVAVARPTVGERETAAMAAMNADVLAELRRRLAGSESPAEVMAALAEIAGSDAALAIDLAHALGKTDEEKAMWVADLAKQWMEREPQQAWDWLAMQDSARIRELATGTLPEVMMGAMAEAHPQLLVHKLDELVRRGETPLGVPPVVAVHLSVEALAGSDQLEVARRAVEAWAHDPTRPAIGESAYTAVAVAMGKTAPDEAGAWLMAMPASGERDVALVEFPAHWAQHDPAGAIQWAERLPSPDLQTRAVQRTFFDWVERHPVEAGEWLGDYLVRAPAERQADRLIEGLINLGPTVKSSAALGLQWVALLSDAGKRSQYEEKVVRRWSRTDLEAAKRHVWSSPGIAPERKAVLIGELEREVSQETEY